MKEKLKKLKETVIEKSKNPIFLHHEWFVDYHLSLVEKIAFELCDIYNDADKEVVCALVWVHDYGKILDMKNQHNLNHKTKELLIEFGFDDVFTKKVIGFLDLMEKKMELDLHEAPIEVQIVSSADGASHMVGPFMSIFWKEYSEKSLHELIDANIKKLKKDWERKIVLPEVKKAFQDRYSFFKELTGEFPEKFL